MQLLKHKWTSLRITFAFMTCPSCKQELELTGVPREIAAELGPLVGFKKEVERLALKNAEEQGILKDDRLRTPTDFYFGKPQEFANHRCSFYQCHECKKPYFGGLIDCEQEMGMEDTTRREDLICRPCLMKEMSIGANICRNGHGAEFIDWKCMYCCRVALFSCCGGTKWFCDPCHRDPYKAMRNPKNCNGKNCPLKIPHPPASNNFKKSAFPLGCSICRSEHLEEYDQAQDQIR